MTTLFCTSTVRNAAIAMAAFCLAPPAHAQAPATATPPPLFASVGDRPAILYDALSTKSNKTFILSRFHPLEVLVRLDKWSKVRDQEGTIGWIENSSLGDRRFVAVASGTADVRAQPQPASPLVFEAQKGVLLEVTGPAVDGWLPVKHRDGQTGYARSPQLFGG